jgi:hypothetical protein
MKVLGFETMSVGRRKFDREIRCAHRAFEKGHHLVFTVLLDSTYRACAHFQRRACIPRFFSLSKNQG